MPTPYDNTNFLQQLQQLLSSSSSSGNYTDYSSYANPQQDTSAGVIATPNPGYQFNSAAPAPIDWSDPFYQRSDIQALYGGANPTAGQLHNRNVLENNGVDRSANSLTKNNWMGQHAPALIETISALASLYGIGAGAAGLVGGGAGGAAGSGVSAAAGGGALSTDAALGAATDAGVGALGAGAAGTGAAAAGAGAAAAGAALPEIVVTGTVPAGLSAGSAAGIGAGVAGAGAAAANGAGTTSTGSGNGTNSSSSGGMGNSILDGLKGMGAGDWLSTLSQLYGAYQSAQGASGARSDLNSAANRITTQLGASTLTGPGGLTATTNQNGEGGSYGVGDLESLRTALAGLANSSSASAAKGGLPDSIAQALGQVQGAQGTPNAPDTSQLQGLFDQSLGTSFNAMNRGSVAPGLAATSFAGAGKQLADASTGFGDLYNSTLANLRAQSQPDETRAYDTLQNDLFSTGRSGSSGGALQTEAFARGLGQADLSRQLAATQVAQNAQQNALQVGTGLANVGSNVSGLDENLLNSAFGRFAQTAGLSSDLTQQRFGNSVLLNNTGYDRSNTNLGNQITAAQLPTALQGSQLALALQSLSGTGDINTQGLQQFQAALAQAQAGANARLGNGSAVAALAGTRAQLPSSSDIWGQVLTGIGNRIGSQNTQNNGNGLLSALFGGGNGGYQSGTYAPDGTFYPG